MECMMMLIKEDKTLKKAKGLHNDMVNMYKAGSCSCPQFPCNSATLYNILYQRDNLNLSLTIT